MYKSNSNGYHNRRINFIIRVKEEKETTKNHKLYNAIYIAIPYIVAQIQIDYYWFKKQLCKANGAISNTQHINRNRVRGPVRKSKHPNTKIYIIHTEGKEKLYNNKINIKNGTIQHPIFPVIS